ncbi:aminomethyl transferase family protein [Actinoplanes sp. CA-142083]|uniref:aminomethyl transferase family protein n=1 Tax=Actinoplanes sp. CA-142083 TaxID=3239903 RepID=UPI003D8A6CED
MTLQRETYEAVVRHREGAFVSERPALFSPAAAAQDPANAKGAYAPFAQILLPQEYTGWAEESTAHVRGCYLGDWTSLNKIEVSGPQALDFLSWLGMNDLSVFHDGQIKHHVQLDEHGWVASEGVLCRLGEEKFLYTAGSGDWLRWQFSMGNWDASVTDVSPDLFIFGVQGPESFAILQSVLGGNLRDLGFNRSRPAFANGVGVRVLRTGISGELGYEVHGPAAYANEVWKAIAGAGNVTLLGLRSQSVQHIEAGIATNGLDYLPAAILTPGAPTQFRRGKGPGGSFVPGNVTDYFRKPGELGWLRGRISSHDFLGRDALVADAGERKLVGLRWDNESVAAIAAGLFDGVEQMELPRLNGPSFDQILIDGVLRGVSTGRALSLTVGATISLGVLETAHTTPGTEVTVLWGRPGTTQREIPAVVTELPFKPDRRRTDVSR